MVTSSKGFIPFLYCPSPGGRGEVRGSFINNEKEERGMKVKPLGDRVLVQRVEAEEKTKGGIILPDTAKEKPKEGKVLSVGEGKVNAEGKRTALTVKEGDRVLFTSYAGTDIKLDGQDYIIMREEDILAILV